MPLNSVMLTNGNLEPIKQIIKRHRFGAYVVEERSNGVFVINLDGSILSVCSKNNLGLYYEFIAQRASTYFPENVLILGFGTGTIARLLTNYCFSVKIVGVDFDSDVLDIYKNYFGVLDNVELHCLDVEKFLSLDSRKFDCIIVDLYCGLSFDKYFNSIGFYNLLKERLFFDGVVFQNFLNKKMANFGKSCASDVFFNNSLSSVSVGDNIVGLFH